MRKLKSKQGFTLIEIVVVMAIIAVLAVLVVGAIVVARNTARETANRSSGKSIQAGLEGLYSRARAYNANPGGGQTAVLATDTCATAATKLSVAATPSTSAGGGCTVTAIAAETYIIQVWRSDGTTAMETYQQQ